MPPFRCIFLFTALSVAPGFSGERPATSTQPEPSAYSDAFDQLIRLGLPDLKNAKWTILPERISTPYSAIAFHHSDLAKKLRRAGWIIGDPGSKPLALVPGTVEPVPWQDADHSGTLPDKQPEFLPFLSPPPPPTIESVAAAALDLLRAQREDEDFPASIDYYDIGAWGSLLIFAAQLHQTGHDALADRLASELFSTAPNKIQLINAAVSHIAYSDYQKATDEFFDSFDWRRYHDRLSALLERYPRGWNIQHAVALLVERIEKRIGGAPLPSIPVEIEGIRLDPKAVAALDSIVRRPPPLFPEGALPPGLDPLDFPKPSRKLIRKNFPPFFMQRIGRRMQVAPVWLLCTKRTELDPQTRKHPIQQIVDTGVDALPALAAVATDPTLSYMRYAYRPFPSFLSKTDPSTMPAEDVYRNIDRPLTRGELACELINDAIPVTVETRGFVMPENPKPEDFREAALEFHQSHPDKSLLSFALSFFDADFNFRKKALYFLCTLKNSSAHAAFEKHIIESDEPADYLTSVEFYLSFRGADAAPFCRKYSTLVRQLYGDLAVRDFIRFKHNAGGTVEFHGGLENLLHHFSILAAITDPCETARHAITQSESWKEFQENASVLGRLFLGLPRAKIAEAYLRGAAATEDPTRRALLLRAMSETFSPSSIMRTEEELCESHSIPPLPKSLRDIAKKLLADTRHHSLRMRSKYLSTSVSFGLATVGDHAAMALEAYYDPALSSRIKPAMQTTGKLPGPMLRSRIRARLEGRSPSPPFPDAAKVSAERMKQIIATASPLKPMPLLAFVTSLPQDEIAAWRAWANFAMQSPKPPPFLLSARNILTERADPVTRAGSIFPPSCLRCPPASPFQTGDDLGDAKSLRRLCTETLRRAKNLSPSSFQISRQRLGIGSKILCIHPDFSDPVLSSSPMACYLKPIFEDAASLLEKHESWSAVLVVTLDTSTPGDDTSTPTTHIFRLDSHGAIVFADPNAPASGTPSAPIDGIASRLASPGSGWKYLIIEVFARKDLKPFDALKDR